jgi:hypothetical protein
VTLDIRLVFTALAALFLVLGVGRALWLGPSHPQPRALLLVGAIFSVVAAWLWSRAGPV